jgi:hypothetical protein
VDHRHARPPLPRLNRREISGPQPRASQPFLPRAPARIDERQSCRARLLVVRSGHLARPSGGARSCEPPGRGSPATSYPSWGVGRGVCSALAGSSGPPASYVISRPSSAESTFRRLSLEARRPAGGAGRLVRGNRWLLGNLEWFSRPSGSDPSVAGVPTADEELVAELVTLLVAGPRDDGNGSGVSDRASRSPTSACPRTTHLTQARWPWERCASCP